MRFFPPPQVPPVVSACPLALLWGWGIEHVGDGGKWYFRSGGEVYGARLAVIYQRSEVRKAVSIHVLGWAVAFRYGRPVVARVKATNADEVSEAVVGLAPADEQKDRELIQRIRREQAERN